MNNEVEIVVTGDNKSKAPLQDAERGVKSLGDAAERSGDKLEGMSTRTDRLSRLTGQGGRSVEEYGTGLGGMGDRADEADTRMMGLADGITGVTDLMGGNGKLRPHEFAMAFSDLGSSLYNFVIPQLQSVSKAVGGVVSGLTGAGGPVDKFKTSISNMSTTAKVAGGVAGVGAIVFGVYELNKAISESRIKKLADDFKRTGEAGEELNEALRDEAAGSYMNDLNDTLRVAEGGAHDLDALKGAVKALADESPMLAQAYVNEAEAAGLSKGAIKELNDELDANATSSDIAADAVSGYNDRLMALTDPVFGAISAQNDLTAAQQATNDAIKERGAGSAEARDATLAQAEAAARLDSALLELQQGVEDGSVSMSAFEATLQRWVADGKITARQADTVRARFDDVRGAAENVPERVRSTVQVDGAGRAIGRIRDVGAWLNTLPKRKAIQVAFEVYGQQELNRARALADLNAHGGITGAQGGGQRTGLTWVGERGAELMQLPPGTRVYPHQTSMAMAGGGGGGTLKLEVRSGGSRLDDLLVEVLRRAIRDAHGGDVQAALGWQRG